LIFAEEQELERLERLLGLSGKNSKSSKEKLNQEFMEEDGFGGDFLSFLDDLEGMDKRDESFYENIEEEEDDELEDEMSEEEMLDASSTKIKRSYDELDEDSDDESEIESEESEEESEESEDDDSEEESENKSEEDDSEEDKSEEEEESEEAESFYHPSKGQDIYGRSKNGEKESMNAVIIENESSQRMENSSRATLTDEELESVNFVTKTLRGPFNRLGTNTLHSTFNLIRNLYQEHPNAIVNESLRRLFFQFTIHPTQVTLFYKEEVVVLFIYWSLGPNICFTSFLILNCSITSNIGVWGFWSVC